MSALLLKILTALGADKLLEKFGTKTEQEPDTEAVKIAKIEAESEDKKRNKYLIALKWLSLFVLAWNFVLVPIVGIWYVLPMLPVAELVKAIIALSLGS
jgi:hypothetical protein